ncbi:MAG: diaminopimelate decarboxylase [Chlorobiaceae bacterium]|nr:diaminopimelate decarboxylase [Chlorobiaceae bacterium]NTW74650.1 diaminopimelate decarboxylase [Chlorobiaceae bacterium]
MLDSHFFSYSDGTLCCDEVRLDGLAEQFGTPLYVISRQSLINQFRSFEAAFAGLPHFTCYSVKANFNLSVIRTLVDEGCGCDVNSGGELFRALKAGISPDKIIMAGVGKTEQEIEYGLNSGVLLLKSESVSELKAIDRVAGRLGKKANVAIRINPNVTAETHPYITTGDSKEKFGIDEAELGEVFGLFRTLPNLSLDGLDMHIGSQIFDPEYYVAATQKLLDVLDTARLLGFDIKWFDIGGGFPVTYDPQKPATPIDRFAEKLVPMLDGRGVTVIFEPGRFIAANSSVLLTKVLYRKRNHVGKEFFIVDAGMTELIRPALYQSHHEVISVKRHEDSVTADVVGPVCESSDFFARQRMIDNVREGELLAVLSTGAYAAVMGSNYNGRLRPAEVMVDGGEAKLVRRRETYEQLVQNEV